MKKKIEKSELENRSNVEPAVGTVAQTSAEIANSSSDSERSEEDLEEELEEDPEEEEKDESEVDLEEDPEEEQEDSEVEPEKDPDEIMKEDSSTESEQDPDADPSEENLDEDPSEADDEDPSEEDPEEYVSQLNSKSEYVSDDKQKPIDAKMFELSSSQVYESKENCRYKEALKPELSFHSTVSFESASDKKEPLVKSGKQRRSRWEPQLEQDKKSSVLDLNRKRRKTRWDVSDAQLMSNCSKEFTTNQFDSEVLQLTLRLTEINSIVQALKLRKAMPGGCNNLGIRFNNREVRRHKKLIAERESIVAKLSEKNEAPTVNKPETFCKKLYIPMKEYPTYNFVGLILGPKGNTIKKMEKETGAKILLRGKGSVKKKAESSDDEDLHVHIIANSQKSLDDAVAMVDKLLVPIDDHVNEHKLAQLKELAKLRGNYVDENTCRVCWEQGHQTYACPQRPSTFKAIISCDTRGSLSKVSSPPPNFMLDSVQKPKKEIDDSNLYIGYLPKVVDDSRLREMFSPFGKIAKAIVMKDKITGVSKGYGFVRFENATDAATAVMHMNKYQMDGRVLAVRVAGTEPPVTVLPPLAPLPPYPAPAPAPFQMDGHVHMVRAAGTEPSVAVLPPLAPLPPYPASASAPAPAPAPLYPGGMNQAAWPGQPSSTYYGHVSQYSSVGSTNITPLSFITGLKESKAEPDMLAKFPGDPDYPGLAKFPGDPDYPGSEFKSYFSTRTL